MGFYFCYKTKADAKRQALKSFKMPVIIEAEEIVKYDDESFYSWLVVSDVMSGRKFIEILFLKSYDGQWGYKFINESQGIQVFDCPLAFLDDANTDINKDWRKQVYLYHKDARALI